MPSEALDQLVRQLARLPGLGPRSARRAALHLLKKPEAHLRPLAEALSRVAREVVACGICGNLDTQSPCGICRDGQRDGRSICVVEEVDDLWAMERGRSFRGRYHVLGGTLRAIDGITPESLRIPDLVRRIETADPRIEEVILALGVTVDGQTTAHYLAERLAPLGVTVTRLGHGVPLGGQLGYLDDGTIDAALRSRRPLG
ncbi:MAG: recombination protein RecR [Geminicoccaceae bacterium]|nr:MAG: recombination protein RecR [Geminicoccaceae bacterium]